jgi:hypothetical protein
MEQYLGTGEEIRNYNLRGNVATRQQEAPETPLTAAQRRVKEVGEQILRLTNCLNTHADDLFGPPPPMGLEGAKDQSTPGAMARLLREISDLEDTISPLEHAIGRFANLA